MSKIQIQRQAITLVLLLLFILLTSTVHADPRVGTVTALNSIIGSHDEDQIGSGGVYALPSGNIVIASPYWNDYRGAVTCLTPEEYRAGGIVVSAANSLVGVNPSDGVAYDDYSPPAIIVLANGNYLVRSFRWYDNTGAVTWVNGSTCIPRGETTRGAVISATNSLIGTYGGDQVGRTVIALPNGHYVVFSSSWDNGATPNVGAVTWGNGNTGTVGTISAVNSLIGSQANDHVGSGGYPTILSNGHYVVESPFWDNGAVVDAGAVTWGNKNGGTVGVVSKFNSLVGTSAGDKVGNDYAHSLANGHYAVASSKWDNGGITDVGAVTWGNGNGGTVGAVSSANSLVGSSPDDMIYFMMALTNGHYVVGSASWDNGAAADAGAMAWANGNGGTVGIISPANAIVGSQTGDKIGYAYVRALTNGNYVIASPFWDNGIVPDAGASTWGNGLGGTVGVVSPANSLVGSQTNDKVGRGDVFQNDSTVVLTNGNYVVVSVYWNNGAASAGGAVTWGNGNGGTVGEVSAANSIVGSTATDNVGGGGVTALTNGNYVIHSPSWQNAPSTRIGAATWGNGNVGTVGEINPANSLVGSTAGDNVGDIFAITALTNGNYVVASSSWDNGGIANAGAATWGDGVNGTTGVISAANSVVGSSEDDNVGNFNVVPLTNGNYLICAYQWRNGSAQFAGAAVWGNGSGGTIGEISAANAIVGSQTGDAISVLNNIEDKGELANGNYVIFSPSWSNGATASVGAVTWANADGSTVGVVSGANSLIGVTTDDQVGSGGITPLADSSFIVISPLWSNGTSYDAGAVTWSDGAITPPSPAIVLSKIAAEVIEGDATADYTVVLRTEPTHPVTINLGVDVENEITLSATSLVFDATNWFQPQVVTITAIDDADTEGTENLVITHTVTSADSNYNGIIPAPDDEITVTIIDNENVTPVLASIGDRTTYLGKTLTFDVDADDENLPAQTLTFSLDSGAPTGTVIDPVSGLFSWTLDETVTVGEYPITITVTDDGDPALTDSETFTVTVEAVNLVSNYGFENPGSNEKLAAGWAALQLTANDRRMCDTETKSYAREGACAYRFSITKNTTLKRTIQKSASKAGLVKNDTLELRGWVKATNLTTGARLSLTVTYNNGTTKVVNINLPPGTHDYQLFNKQVTLTRPVKSLKVKIEARKAKGTFLVDDISVVKVEPDPLALSLPVVPDLRGVD